MAISSFLTGAAGKVVNRITISTELTGPMSFQPFPPGVPIRGASPPPETTSPLLKLLKPQIVIDTVAGPVGAAPYGEPSGLGTPLVLLAGVFMLVGAVTTVQAITQTLRGK
jgi:hypothetical protein